MDCQMSRLEKSIWVKSVCQDRQRSFSISSPEDVSSCLKLVFSGEIRGCNTFAAYRLWWWISVGGWVLCRSAGGWVGSGMCYVTQVGGWSSSVRECVFVVCMWCFLDVWISPHTGLCSWPGWVSAECSCLRRWMWLEFEEERQGVAAVSYCHRRSGIGVAS